MSEIELLDGVKEYGHLRALDHVNLRVEPGELVVLLGPSGCGKSTLLRAIAGLEPLSGGSLKLAGVEASRGERVLVPPEQRRVGLVFQDLALWPHLSAEANIAYPLAVRGVAARDRRERARELMDLLDLEVGDARRPGQLSGGERQRVALARALVAQPRVLLMDEPLASLDTHLRRRLRQKIRRIHEGFRMTTLYVTHDREEALGLADRLVLLRRGRVVEEGRAHALYERPRSAFAAQLLSDTNLLPATYLRNGWWRTPVGVLKGPAPSDDGTYRLLIRPETIVRAEGDADFAGEVDTVSFRGGFWEAEVNVRGEEILWRSTSPVAPRDQVQLRLNEEPHPVVDDATAGA